MHNRPWTKVWTKILDNTFLMNDVNAYVVFTKLLFIANNSGEYCTTTRAFARFVGIDYPACRRTLDRLEVQGMVERFATERGKNTIFKIRKWKTYQGLTQKTAQRAAQPTTDIFEHKPAQVVTQQAAQKRRRSGAEQPNLQGSKMPLDIDNRNNYKGFEISDVQLLDEIKAFIDYRTKKDKGFTQHALNLNIADAKRYYPNDIEIQKACFNQSIARGWSGIYPIKDPSDRASLSASGEKPAKRVLSVEETEAWERRKQEQTEALRARHEHLVALQAAKRVAEGSV